jgi:hypothetical protein
MMGTFRLSSLEPFTVPTLGPNEVLELGFTIEIPTSALPLSIPAQFAAGEGTPDGQPIFTGDHPAQYFTATDNVASFVPEPSSMTLALVSIVTMGTIRFRRRSGRSAIA